MAITSTGSIIVQEELDYELKNSYDLTITATDFQTGAYSSAIVHIDLEVITVNISTFIR